MALVGTAGVLAAKHWIDTGGPEQFAQGAQDVAGAIGALFASSQSKNAERAQTSLGIAAEHLGRVANMGPDDQDPRKRRDWLKHAQKHINNAGRYVEKVKGKTGQAIREAIRRAQEQLDTHTNP